MRTTSPLIPISCAVRKTRVYAAIAEDEEEEEEEEEFGAAVDVGLGTGAIEAVVGGTAPGDFLTFFAAVTSAFLGFGERMGWDY